ncbi:unnamed protein product [Amaranthus hypochondriacus]
MEYFSCALKKLKGGDIKYYPKCKASSIIELMFTDHVLIFTKPNLHPLGMLKVKIGDFAKISGLHINSNKTAIYLAGVQEEDEARTLEGVLKGDLPFKYLRFPLSSKRLSFLDCKGTIDRITTRIKH